MPRIEFPAEDGTILEGRLTVPGGVSVGGAVLCHPHPKYDGSMDSWMMPVLQRAVVYAGWTALRFNFRGVGRSAGEKSGENGAIGDLAGAVTRVREECDGPVLVGGWSLGTGDQFTSVEEIERFVGEAAEPKRLRLVDGGDHFLAQHGDVLAAEVRSFAESIT